MAYSAKSRSPEAVAFHIPFDLKINCKTFRILKFVYFYKTIADNESP